MEIRLQKRIAQSGLCSRRKAEVLIEEGKVKVNGQLVTILGTKVLEIDLIEVNGNLLEFPSENITIAINKPSGYITSMSDPYHSRTVMDLIPEKFQHLKPAGRLDKDTEGLLLLSSDGDLIQKLTHPRYEHSKTYEVLVKGTATEENLQKLTDGSIKLDDYTLNAMGFEITNIQEDGRTWITLKLSEGRKRQIRRVMDSLGHPVIYLRRIAIGKLGLQGMKKGDYRVLENKDIQDALS